jgi:hypothetical protein
MIILRAHSAKVELRRLRPSSRAIRFCVRIRHKFKSWRAFEAADRDPLDLKRRAHSAKVDTGFASECALTSELARFPGGRPVSTRPENAPGMTGSMW